MSDAIRAALISGGIQFTTALLTLFVGLSALSSWRRNALGARQIQLAEECLQFVWKLDAKIKATRFLLPPRSLEELKKTDNPRVKENYTANHQRALAGMRDCLTNLRELEHKLMLAEFYLGDLPRTKTLGGERFFNKMSYSLYQEYDEILPQLLMHLMNVSPERLSHTELTSKSIEEFDKSANMFYGFIYEYEQDDFSVRLNVSQIAFERHIKRTLQRQGLRDRFLDWITHQAQDRYRNRFKPVTTNKYMRRKWLENNHNATVNKPTE